jgi:stearoyl-CoA 9-desaturase NADPH oxidoreductase
MVATALRTGTVRLASLLTTPLVPADYLDLLDPLHSTGPLRARVVEVRHETEDAATVVLRTGHGWSGHQPGQWLRIGVDIDGVRHWRSYSLTSPPNGRRLASITVKVVPEGLVSTYLVRRARPGMLVHLDQACGDFVLPEIPPRRSLFVTAGSGITPVMGMLRHRLDELEDVVVVHSAPTSDEVIFGDELRQLGHTRRIRLIERHTGTGGRLTPTQLSETVPDWSERETWGCGPTDMLDALEAHWSAHGLGHRLHLERFRPKVTPGDGGAGGEVTFDQSGVTVRADADTPLLEAGEDAGVLLRSGCRMGICFGCVTPLQSGAVRDIRTGTLITADGGPVLIQTCVSAAAGPCQLDA